MFIYISTRDYECTTPKCLHTYYKRIVQASSRSTIVHAIRRSLSITRRKLRKFRISRTNSFNFFFEKRKEETSIYRCIDSIRLSRDITRFFHDRVIQKKEGKGVKSEGGIRIIIQASLPLSVVVNSSKSEDRAALNRVPFKRGKRGTLVRSST